MTPYLRIVRARWARPSSSPRSRPSPATSRRALPGSFKQSKDKTHLVGDDYVITWAVGHLVGLAEPDAYDPKLKKWRFADLPILPEKFKLVPNDERAEEAAEGDPQADGGRRDRR